jgi:hypothetical protein
MAAKYDSIGINYAELRKPDPRIAAAIQGALGQADTVLNVGARTGSYEPVDRQVTARFLTSCSLRALAAD